MVDNRSAGFYGIGGAFNFKSGDPSGTAAKMSDEKMGQGGEYMLIRNEEEESEYQNNTPYVDRSAQLRATLNSLAMMNVASVLNSNKRKNSNLNENTEPEDYTEEEPYIFDMDMFDEAEKEESNNEV